MIQTHQGYLYLAECYDLTQPLLTHDFSSVHFDDTIGIMDVFGGKGNDTFKVGQMFNSERNETYGVSTDDPIDWTLTTKGFLSDGCSHDVTINGGYGNDAFDVLRNKCILDLNGESGKS